MEPTLRRRIPAEVQTLHRLLGRMPGRLELRHDRSRLLPYDLVVVDEVSMVDQGLAAALIEALPEDAHLLLVGDPEQLDPVSPGRLFGDLVAALPAEVPTSIAELFAELANAKAPLPAVDGPRAGAMVPLLRAHRFREGGPIGKIARAIRERDPGLVQAAFDGGTQAEWTRGAPDRSELLARWIEARRAVAGARTPSRALEAAAKFQVLTATRVGPLGASALQAFAEAELQREHGWPRGALRLILRNDRMSGLSNGDLGVVWSEEGPPSVWFSSPIGPPRAFGASELPEHESGAALTVHKSQGSEFEEVWVILPEDPGEAPARALLYTAVTRARQKVRLFATEAVLEATLRQDAVRETGLRLALESMF